MSGVRRHKRILKTTVAAAAAGAVAFAPLAPLAQEAGAVTEPLVIRVGAAADYTRVEFAGVVGARSRVSRDGRTVIVRMGVTAAPDVSRLKVDPPRGVEKVETRAIQGATELVLTLAEGAEARSGSADGAVWLNLYPTAPDTDAPAPAAGAAIQASVPVRATTSGDSVSLAFAWTAPVGAAVFRRNDAVWVVFDTAAKLDMSGARALGPATDARWAAGPDYVALRIAAPANLPVSARAEGSTWTVTIGGVPMASQGITVDRGDSGEPVLVASMAGSTRAIWLTDPQAGDRFAAVTALAPGKGFAARRQTIDMTLLPTAHGLAVETPADDLMIRAEGDLVTLSRPGGLILSPPSAETVPADETDTAPKRAPMPALILPEWADLGEAGFNARYRALQSAAAEEGAAGEDAPRAPIEARMAYARFLVGSGLGYEAIGVLNAIVAVQPNMLGEPELRGLRGAARVQIGRLEEATADFSGASLAGDPSTRVWQGYIAARQGDWAEARRAFADGASAIDRFTPFWRARFGVAHAEAAIETGDLVSARALLAYAFSQDPPAAEQLVARNVQARLFELEGQTDRALAVFKAVARAPLDSVVVPARLGVVRIELARGAMKPVDAARELEQLKWRWRGDATELAVIRELGRLYLSQGLYREALTVLAGAGQRMSRLPGAAELQTDLDNAFRALFLEGGADGLQPVQALGLFYDFRQLTPIGADGDEMVRRLSRRLVDVDLLDQAAELLKYQVDNRLEGVAKASVATDLAAIYLMDRQPEAALQAIWGSRTTLLPAAMTAERRSLEARALMELGRFDHALEVLGTDASGAARDVKAEIYWKQKNWTGAAAIYEQRLGDRWKTPGTLTPDEESRLLRAGVGYSLGNDLAALDRLSRNYAGFIAGARSADALRIALDGGVATAGDFAALVVSADTFTGWVNSAKAQFRQRTAR